MNHADTNPQVPEQSRAKPKPTVSLNKRVRLMLILLTAQYFFGMILNLMGPPDPFSPTLKKVVFGISLLLHLIAAVALLVLAGRTLATVKARRIDADRLETWGAASIVAAFVSGILTVTTTMSAVFAFLMAAGFILAFIFYGRLYLKLRTTPMS